VIMKVGSTILEILKGVAAAMSVGLIGRGRKVQGAGTIASQLLENIGKKEVQ
jgi:hypothetical protein